MSHTTTTATTTTFEEDQAIAFDKTTAKGKDGGLFQACMKSIRTAHASANRLRTGLVLAGLFTDKTIYREVIAMFYVATKEMETKLMELQKDNDDSEICNKLLSLGYRFTPQYEKDLQSLYSKESWEKEVHNVLENSSCAAKSYIHKIRSMTSGVDLAGAAFCLWGALIIGGGAVAMPRVQALCGNDAIHIFKDVTGPGRGERKTKFVQLWDNLVVATATTPPEDEDTTTNFTRIVSMCQECMQGNNELIASVKKNPWWLKYYAISTAVVGVAALGVYLIQQRRGK